jgi:hypothetical protein
VTKPGVEIEGVNKLARALRDADAGMAETLKAAHLDGAKAVLNAVRAPVQSGDLRATLKASATLRSGRVKAGRKKVPYAGPIHFGWQRRNIRPNPFLYDALDRRRQTVIALFMDGIESLTEQVVEDANRG